MNRKNDIKHSCMLRCGLQCRPSKFTKPVRFNFRGIRFRQKNFSEFGHKCQTQASSMWNPQNTEEATVLPCPGFSAADCVAVQLDALADCDQPWPLHGIRTAYEFGYDIGGLDPSYYFGFRKDLYHFDHFMGIFQNHLPELVGLSKYEIISVNERPLGDGRGDDGSNNAFSVAVSVHPQKKGSVTEPSTPVKFIFHLRRKSIGTRKGSLMTEWIEKVVD